MQQVVVVIGILHHSATRPRRCFSANHFSGSDLYNTDLGRTIPTISKVVQQICRSSERKGVTRDSFVLADSAEAA
jgi:hypothetical protein